MRAPWFLSATQTLGTQEVVRPIGELGHQIFRVRVIGSESVGSSPSSTNSYRRVSPYVGVRVGGLVVVVWRPEISEIVARVHAPPRVRCAPWLGVFVL
jgi:hypothetical protein